MAEQLIKISTRMVTQTTEPPLENSVFLDFQWSIYQFCFSHIYWLPQVCT